MKKINNSIWWDTTVPGGVPPFGIYPDSEKDVREIDEIFLEELAQDMRDNGVEDEIFISETIAILREGVDGE